jgi:coiled-coil domain-containing protein 77
MMIMHLRCRRHLDMEGFSADITYLRKMLTAVDRKLHEMRLVERCVCGEEVWPW